MDGARFSNPAAMQGYACESRFLDILLVRHPPTSSHTRAGAAVVGQHINNAVHNAPRNPLDTKARSYLMEFSVKPELKAGRSPTKKRKKGACLLVNTHILTSCILG